MYKIENTRILLNQRFLCFYFFTTVHFRFYVPCTPTRKRFDQTVGFYEADSAHEMTFLLKNYGYQAVDREDQKKYAKKAQLARA
ncbi:hypothetical protein SFC81_02715 [Enterococcus faecalis]